LEPIYEVRPRKDHRGFDLISDALPFGRLWYTEPDDAVEYAKFFSRSHHAVIRVYDDAGNVIETHEHAGDFKEPVIGKDRGGLPRCVYLVRDYDSMTRSVATPARICDATSHAIKNVARHCSTLGHWISKRTFTTPSSVGATLSTVIVAAPMKG
jgi:hypothetical protein